MPHIVTYELGLSWICFMLAVSFWCGNERPLVLPIIDVVVGFTSLVLRQLELTTSCTRILIGNKQIQ